MTDNNERARFDAWWLGEDGPYSIRAERPSSMTEAAWAGWRAREAENARLRAALQKIAKHSRGGVIDTTEKMDRDEFIGIARAALEGK